MVLKLRQVKYFLHIYTRARKMIKIITLFPNGDFSLMHLTINSLDTGKLSVPKLWNLVRSRCCASRPDAETHSCIFRTLIILFIDDDAAKYLGSSALRKVWCWIKVICTLLVKFKLNCVQNVLNRNSTVRIRLVERSGSYYVVCPLMAVERTRVLWSKSMSQLNYNSEGCLPQT